MKREFSHSETIKKDWFKCVQSSDCTVVTDSYCKSKAVNRDFADLYASSRQRKLQKFGKIKFCESSHESSAPTHCSEGVCHKGSGNIEIAY